MAVIAFAFFASNTQISSFALIVAVLSSCALLLNLAREQLAQRQINLAVQWLIILLALLLWLIPAVSTLFNAVLMVWGLIICLIYAIFAGWIMKISHLRKAMNFSNELFYNLWRIAVRVVLPLSIVMAIVAILGQLI